MSEEAGNIVAFGLSEGELLSVCTPSLSASLSTSSSCDEDNFHEEKKTVVDSLATASDSPNLHENCDCDSIHKSFPDPAGLFSHVASGFAGNLDPSQEKTLIEFKTVILQETSNVTHLCNGPQESVDRLFLRFLRARKFKLAPALEMFKKHMEWHAAQNFLELVKIQSVSDILNEEQMEVYNNHFQCWYQGHDKFGHPVFFQHMGKFDVSKMTETIPMDLMLKMHIWRNGKFFQQLKAQSLKTGLNIERVCLVIDVKNWSVTTATPTAYQYLKQIANVDSLNYPERMFKVIVVNAPAFIAVVWKIVSMWLDDTTKDKISIIKSKDEWRPLLRTIIDEDQLPVYYGGQAKSLAGVNSL